MSDSKHIMLIKRQRNFIILIIQTLVFLGCSACIRNANNDLPADENSDLAYAAWISVQEDLPCIDSLLYDDDPSPIFRKEFTVRNDIQ
ncbi:MAG: hypothetical protein DRJ29_11615, partial [Bacteroidetes bacterium]